MVQVSRLEPNIKVVSWRLCWSGDQRISISSLET